MSFFGVTLDVQVKKLLNDLKIYLQKKGGIGIRSLAFIFKKMDFNGNKKLDQQEFTDALAQFGFFPKIVDIQALMKYFDLNNDGNITYEEFLRGLREPMNERRLILVNKAYDIMDKDHSGKITAEDLKNVFVVEKHPDFINGSKTKEQIFGEFLASFEGAKGNKDSVITKEEFTDYYTDISMSIASDDYFVEMMQNAWMIMEDESLPLLKEKTQELIKTIRMKLQSLTKGNQTEYFLRKLYRQYNTTKSGYINISELEAIVLGLGISVEKKYMASIFKAFDTNNSGTIEFEEFCNFIINSPLEKK